MSYFPCDEGLYKKKYLNEKDKEFLTGIELVIDDILPNYWDNNEIEDIEDIDIAEWETGNEELENTIEDFIEDVDRENICLSRAEFLTIVKAIQRSTCEGIEHWIECNRGTQLVSMIDEEYSDKTNEELEPFWKSSAEDEYPSEITDEDKYTYNSNGKVRPRWNEE